MIESGTGFGIDLAGYSVAKTSVAFAEIVGRRVEATVLYGSKLAKKRAGHADLQKALEEDILVLRMCMKVAPVAVDIPIDLQGVGAQRNPKFVWELTRRPIDRKLRAMAPLADRIGAPVARFAAVMKKGRLSGVLGKKLFEAYPGGTLRSLGIEAKKYKGAEGVANLSKLCRRLGVRPALKGDDDFDAVVCAIIAAMPKQHMRSAGSFGIDGQLPTGFRIPSRFPFKSIQINHAPFETWIRTKMATRQQSSPKKRSASPA